MQLSQEEIFEALVTPIPEPRLIKELKAINQSFTSHRQNIGEYVMSLEMVSAYTMFYMPTNIPKLSFVLDQLPKEIREDIGECDFIDVGTGPGTYLLAFLDYFKDMKHGSVWGLDSSSMMRKQADKCLKTFFPETDFYIGSSLPENEPGQTLFFGNSINEMGLNKALEIVDAQEAEYVILIEPGTSEFFNEALRMRDLMKSRGYQILYPCFSSNFCPLSEKEGDWCHQVLRTTHDPSVERLSQLISRDRRVMPLIAQVYRKGEERIESDKYRMIRFLGESKFSFDWEVCHFDSQNKVFKLEVLKKKHSKAECKLLKKTQVGESFNIELLKELSPSHFRGRVILNNNQ